MAIVTQSTGAQSSAAINGQSLQFFASQIAQHMPGCPDPMINTALQNTLRDFYYRSGGWSDYVGPYYISANQPVIELNPVDQYSQVHLVLGVFLYPDTTGVFNPKWLRPWGARRYSSDVGPPNFFSNDTVDRIRVFPTPDLNYGDILYVHAIMMPVINTARLPNIAVTHHFDAILYGTLLRLGIMPNKPWSIKDQAILREYRMNFNRGIVLARDLVRRGYGPADATGRFPNFAGSYSQSPNTAGGATF